ncbi:DUF6682 family protein [Edwardsiella piscicida]|uniref:phage adaptor protein n=1 Tax=Edwardsiella piscicida TaxID=1263550 RepID=UPI00084C903D|nr:DUF6682 family protein [Edwardsiella piscicida]AOP42941.1 hypothetical protein A9797_07920 [Edwardsiella piscicida]EKS7767204.1 hypothetical protein [Edwardsiella piscicida]UCQ32746.1 hypothetical protein DCF74_08175 [Edwardsiella piscicida]UCQ59063.1 hypothetical protein DCF40_08165 [Edwardsiella piscicida]
MTTIADVIGRVNTQLKDTLWARWPLAELCDYFNDAVRAILLVRPEAGAHVTQLHCVAGTQQRLPAGVFRLLEIVRVHEGRALLPVPREVLDTQYPDWHRLTGPVERYCYSDRTPLIYYLFPGVEAVLTLDAVVCRIPATVSIATLQDDAAHQAVPLDPAYINPLIDWMLYRAFSKDNEGGANVALAMQHYQVFAEQLGSKQRADAILRQQLRVRYTGGEL